MLSINIADVVAVLDTMKIQLIVLGVFLALAIIVTVAVMKVKKPLKGFIRKEAWLAFFLAAVIIATNIVLVPMYSMINMAMGGGTISDESIDEAKALCTEIAEDLAALITQAVQHVYLVSGPSCVFCFPSMYRRK